MDFVSDEISLSKSYRVQREKMVEEANEWRKIRANNEKGVEEEEKIKLFVHSDSDSRFLLLIFSANSYVRLLSFCIYSPGNRSAISALLFSPLLPPSLSLCRTLFSSSCSTPLSCPIFSSTLYSPLFSCSLSPSPLSLLPCPPRSIRGFLLHFLRNPR